MPALLVIGLVMFVIVCVTTAPENELVADYAHEAERQFQKRDYGAANVCYERLVKLRPKNAEYRFRLAETFVQLKNEPRATAIISRLAPMDAPGYAPAQVSLAGKLLAGAKLSKEAKAEAEVRLLHALQTEPNSTEANTLLGKLYFASGRPAQAEPHLQRAAPSQPELYLLLASACKAQGKEDGVSSAAEQAKAAFALRVKNQPENVNDRVSLALASVYLKDYKGAVAILKEGIEGNTDPKKPKLKPNPDPRFKSTLANVYMVWSDSLALDPQTAPGERLKALEQGLSYDPDSNDLVDRLTRLIQAGGPDGQRAREALQAFSKSDRIPASIHFALGVDAWERKEMTEAREHFELAYKLAPTNATAANNLAWVLAHEPPVDLPRALQLIDQAVEQQPQISRYRGTRGHIMARMGRWKEALTDLEMALRTTPNSPELHKALAEVYDHLGAPDIAAQHRGYTASDSSKQEFP